MIAHVHSFKVVVVPSMFNFEELLEFKCFISLLGSMVRNWRRCHLLEPGTYTGVKECVVAFLMRLNR